MNKQVFFYVLLVVASTAFGQEESSNKTKRHVPEHYPPPGPLEMPFEPLPPYELQRPLGKESVVKAVAVGGLALLAIPAGLALLSALLPPINLGGLTLSSSGRRRRSVPQTVDALRGTVARLPPDMADRALARYVACAGLETSSEHCLQRMACEAANGASRLSAPDRRMLSTIVQHVVTNQYISSQLRRTVRKAAEIGRFARKCEMFVCKQVNQQL